MKIIKSILIIILAALLLPVVPGEYNTSYASDAAAKITKNNLVFNEDDSVWADVEVTTSQNSPVFAAIAIYNKNRTELFSVDADYYNIQNNKLTINKELLYYPKKESSHAILFLWGGGDSITPLCKPIIIAPADRILKGSLVLEAEDLITNESSFASKYTESALSRDTGVRLSGSSSVWQAQEAISNGADLKASFYLPEGEEDGRYKLWIRSRNNSSQSASIYRDLNNGSVYAGYITSSRDGSYYWNSFDIYLKHGSNEFSIYYRTPVIVDKFIVTSNMSFTPSDADSYPDYLSIEEQEKLWSELWQEPEITPPKDTHPRLYMTADTKDEIRSAITSANSSVKWMYDQYKVKADDKTFSAALDTSLSFNHSVKKLDGILARTVVYALYADSELSGADRASYGKAAVSHMKDYLKTLRTPDDQADITRERGDVLLTAAVVYDWCYPELTQDDKKFFKSEMLKLVASKEIGWPPTNLSGIASHAGEREIFRDLLAAGIAIYDEYPLLYNLTMGRMMEEMMPSRHWLRAAGRFEQGNDYGEARAFSELWADITLSRMLGKNESVLYKDTDYADTMNSLLYNRMPYGAMLGVGDSYSNRSTDYAEYYGNYPLANHIAGNFYNKPYLKNEFKRIQLLHGTGEFDKFFVMLFENPDVEPKVWDELPLSKAYSYPLSGITARTSWQEGTDSETALAFMDMHEVYIGDHQHKYTGDFQLYYKGLLALNSGLYNSSTAHNEGYNHRAISANTMLVYDPDESFEPGWGYVKVPNDGGQRNPLPNTFTVQKYEDLAVDNDGIFHNENLQVAKDVVKFVGPNSQTPAVSYISGDLTNSYSDKVSSYTRSMAFVDLDGYTDSRGNPYPAAFIVYDKISSSNKAFAKKWLLHSQEEPTISGSQTVIERRGNGFGGKLVNTTLLPESPVINKVGGANGEMFTIDGLDLKPKGSSGNYDPRRETGNWRIEISPSEASKDDTFLNAMYVTDAGNADAISMTKYCDDNFDGVEFLGKMVLFNKQSENKNSSFNITKSGDGFLFAAGLTPGVWQVSGGGKVQNIEVSQSSEALYFEGSSGEYTISPTTNSADNISYTKFDKNDIGDFFIWLGTNSFGASSARGHFARIDAPTYIDKNGKPNVPVDFLRQLGCDVTVNLNSNTAIITKGDKSFILTNGTVQNGTIYFVFTNNSLLMQNIESVTGYDYTYKASANTMFAVPANN